MGNDNAPPKRPTLAAVAAELGVARSTVSNAYNRPDQLSPALRQRVFETAARLGYAGPDPLARGLSRGRAGALGVLYADRLSFAFADPAEVLFLRGIAAAAEEAALGLLLIPGASADRKNPSAVQDAVVDGFVIYSMPDADPLVSAVLSRRLPSVIVDNPQLEGLPYVGIDDEGAARQAAEHLLALGHRRFGIIALEAAPGGPASFLNEQQQAGIRFRLHRERLHGYAAALTQAGLNWASVPVYSVAENTAAEGRAAALELVKVKPRPTALLIMSDELAIGAVDALQQEGLAVPRDISVVSFDDIPTATQVTPKLTTVHQPHVEKGVQAGRLLIAQLRGETEFNPKHLQTRLVVRESAAVVSPLS